MKKDEFEIRRKGIETGFDILFLLELFDTLGYIVFKVLYLVGVASINVVSYTEIFANIVLCGMMFICTKLAHKGYFTAGIFGIIVALFNMYFSGIMLAIIGVLLLVDSIIYLVKHKNTTLNDDKDNEKRLVVSYVLLCIILVSIIVFNFFITKARYNASVGEVLRTREFYDYNIEALSKIEKTSISDSFIHDGNFVKLHVRIENLEKSLKINLTNVQFSLLDENKNDLYNQNVNVCFSELEKCLQSEDIEAGSKLEGYLYFYDSKDNNEYITDFSKMYRVKYLKVMAFADSNTYKDYYLELEQ